MDDGPLDLGLIARSGQMFRWSELSDEAWLIQDGSDWYQIRWNSEPQILQVDSNRDPQTFQKLFRLEKNHAEIRAEMIRRGPEIEPYLLQLAGLRLMRPRCATETLFSFLCTSNNHIKRIAAMVTTLASFGEPHEKGFAFPSCKRIADVSESELRSKGFGYRAATIPKVAKILAEMGGESVLQEWKTEPFLTVREKLMSLPGVGPKLADCILLFALDFGESVPIDTHIWQALVREYHPEWKGTPLTHKKYELAADAFRIRFDRLSGAAHQFLFVENLLNWRDRK